MTPKEKEALKAKSKELLKLNEDYHSYLYISSIESIESEKKRLMRNFGYGI